MEQNVLICGYNAIVSFNVIPQILTGPEITQLLSITNYLL